MATPEKILLIEDDPYTLQLLQKIFSEAGYEILSASSGGAALHLAKQTPPDLIIADILLPDMDGYRLLEQMKAENIANRVPIMILTCLAEEEDKIRGLQLGVIDYVVKPFLKDELLMRVRNILDFYKIIHPPQVPDPVSNLLKYLEKKNLTRLIPRVNKEARLGYEYPEIVQFLKLDEPGEEIALLEKLARQKRLDREFYDLVNVCPQCGHHDVQLRELCPKCASAEIFASDIIVHTKCGYRALEYEYNRDGDKICPACNRKLTGEGVDFEKFEKHIFQCINCHKKFNSPKTNYRCFNCNYDFDGEEIIKKKIYIYTCKSIDESSPGDLQDFIHISTSGKAQPSFAKSYHDGPVLQRLKQIAREIGIEAVSWEYLTQRLPAEIQQCQQNNRQFSLLKITLLKSDSLPWRVQDPIDFSVLKKVLSIIKRCLRNLDILCVKADFEYILLLPETPLTMAKVLGKKMLHYVDELQLPLFMEVALSGFPQDGTKAHELLEVLNLKLAILKPDDSQEEFYS